MKNKFFIIVFLLGVWQSTIFAQTGGGEKVSKKEEYKPMDPLAPSRSAFYTTVVPGLGQIYNKKYWKLPLVYAGIGVPVYFWADNQRNYDRYRNEYKKRLQGIRDEDDSTFGRLDDQRLLDGQNFYRRNRDLSVVVTLGFYILSIVDANVDAHLMQFNVNDRLTIKPAFEFNSIDNTPQQYQYAVNIQYRF